MARLRFLISALALVGACARDSGHTPAERWRRAEELWREKDLGAAFRAWNELDPASAEGAEAHRRLDRAAVEYRRGIELLRSGAPGAREALVAGTAVAPMDPRLYLPLARACRDRGLDGRAGEFYRKYLSLVGAGDERADAEAELGSLGGEPALDGIFEPRASRWPARLGFGGGAAGALATLALAVWWWRRRGPSLAARAAVAPELHPALAYLIGCLRHELLKHRIGAVGDVVQALAAGPVAPAARAFLLSRLYRGEPLLSSWQGHLGTFERALGPRFALARDERSFRDAGRTVAEIVRLEPALERGERGAVARLERAWRRLRAFDAELAALSSSLVRTPIDDALLTEVVRAVRGEAAAGRVVLDELAVVVAPPGIAVEVYRIDLVIILKNIVRNAIVAAGRAEAPRRVAVEVEVALEPTGEELVRVHVRDTSPQPLTVEAIASARLERGLGLANAALHRYDGALEVGPAEGGFAKTVTVRLFRALDDGTRITSGPARPRPRPVAQPELAEPIAEAQR